MRAWIYKVAKKFSKGKQAHVGMEPSKTNQTRCERHHNTFTPSLHLVPFCQLSGLGSSLHITTVRTPRYAHRAQRVNCLCVVEMEMYWLEGFDHTLHAQGMMSLTCMKCMIKPLQTTHLHFSYTQTINPLGAMGISCILLPNCMTLYFYSYVLFYSGCNWPLCDCINLCHASRW